MASKYERITDLYLQTAGEVATPEVWPRFLTTACYNFRLSFDKQVLLFAQRPDATAVLPIEGRQGWNQRFGRWVNRGSKGIAILDSDSNGQARIKYCYEMTFVKWGNTCQKAKIFQGHLERAKTTENRHWPLCYTRIGYRRSMVRLELYCLISWITDVPS